MKVGMKVSFIDVRNYGTSTGATQKREFVCKGTIVRIEGDVATVKMGNGVMKKAKLSDLEAA